jgi:phosphonate utilization transcriptional regulator
VKIVTGQRSGMLIVIGCSARNAWMLRAPSGRGNVTTRRLQRSNTRLTLTADAHCTAANHASCQLQIVDNLHGATSNRNMLKSGNANGNNGGQTAAPTSLASAGSARVRRTASPVDGTIAVLQSNSLPMLVQRELERMILAGDLAAGAKLNEAAVALLLGVSRGPVREAFRALEESGLVRLEKNRGVYVRQIAVAEADEIYELRAVLDEFVGRRVTQKIVPGELRALRTLVDRMDRAASRNDLDSYHQANVEFHDALVRLAGNAKLLLTYRRLVNELNLYRRATLDQAGALPISTREHHDILDKIAAGQAAAAGRALYEHVMGSRERMHRARDIQPAAMASAAVRGRRQR